jgi:hypothetical protein
MLPGALATTVFADQLQAVFKDGGNVNYWVIGGVILMFAVVMLLVRRWFKRIDGGGKNNPEPSHGQPGNTRKADRTNRTSLPVEALE